MSADPSGFSSGDANFYRYCGDNPATNVDTSGECYVYSGSGSSTPEIQLSGVNAVQPDAAYNPDDPESATALGNLAVSWLNAPSPSAPSGPVGNSSSSRAAVGGGLVVSGDIDLSGIRGEIQSLNDQGSAGRRVGGRRVCAVSGN